MASSVTEEKGMENNWGRDRESGQNELGGCRRDRRGREERSF